MDQQQNPKESNVPPTSSSPSTQPPQSAQAPTPEEFKANYAEQMRKATAAAALRRMGGSATAAASANATPNYLENPPSSATPNFTQPVNSASANSIVAPTPSTPTQQPYVAPVAQTDPAAMAELRRREIKERIIASRNLLQQQQQRLAAVSTPQPQPAQQQQQQGGVQPAGAAPPPNPAQVPGNGNGFFADEQGAPAAPAGNRVHWYDHLGENFFQDFILQPFLLTLVLPFPIYVTILIVIGFKVFNKVTANLRLRVADQGPQAPNGHAADQPPQPQPHAPAPPPAPRIKRSKTYKFFYLLFRAFITFFVSIFPFFTIEGLRREMERDGVLEPEELGGAQQPQRPEPEAPALVPAE